jgi:hypothetical protein
LHVEGVLSAVDVTFCSASLALVIVAATSGDVVRCGPSSVVCPAAVSEKAVVVIVAATLGEIVGCGPLSVLCPAAVSEEAVVVITDISQRNKQFLSYHKCPL